MESLVHYLTELCRDLTPRQFRLALHPLMTCLPEHPHIGSPERAADCIATVVARLNLSAIVGGVQPTRYERQLAEALWRWNREPSPPLPDPEAEMAFQLTELEMIRLQAWFERAKTLIEGTVAYGYVPIRQH
jgi:hypothetical protein